MLVTNIKILPCAFCGWHDVEIDEIDVGIHAICCPECRTIGPHDDGEHSVEDAVRKWNTRIDVKERV